MHVQWTRQATRSTLPPGAERSSDQSLTCGVSPFIVIACNPRAVSLPWWSCTSSLWSYHAFLSMTLGSSREGWPHDDEYDQRTAAERDRAQPPLLHRIAERKQTPGDIDRGVEEPGQQHAAARVVGHPGEQQGLRKDEKRE